MTLSTLSFVCEAAIYIYLGLSVWTLKATIAKPISHWSWTFAFCELAITMLARGLSMLAIAGLVILYSQIYDVLLELRDVPVGG